MIPLRLINIISRMFYIHIRLKDVSVLITPIAFLSRNRYICTIIGIMRACGLNFYPTRVSKL